MRLRLQTASFLAMVLLASSCNDLKGKRAEKKASEANVVAEKVDIKDAPHSPDTSKKAVVNKKALVIADKKAEEKNITPASRAVVGQVTFSKAAIEDRTFLYGFDLQYSSGADATYDLITQSLALGHIPATFRRVGSSLQLIGDQARLFESDINHPEILIAQYKIIAETEATLSVEFEHGGLVMNQAMHGKDAPAPQKTWIRSLEFVAAGNYFLQESAIQLQDGSVETYMESLFPRDTLVPAGYQPLLDDAAHEPLAARYRFLANEKVFLPFTTNGVTVRSETQVANRYNIDVNSVSGGTIDFFVTANIPDKFLPAVKSGIEGWNRYFEPQVGRKVMRFLGRLPSSIKIGDPRYNIVNWDSVAAAGAAYETQAADPTTGIQSHSLIYLPFAWYNIGADLWHRRVDASHVDAQALLAKSTPRGAESIFGKGHKVLRCVRSAESIAATAEEMIAQLDADGSAATMSTDEFGMRILTSTLFHEVGHSLGLNHNFKGSLAFDGTREIAADNPTTHSIMDYNYYQHELGFFGELGTSSGQSLEYDRQIISQLYNNGADVAISDPVLPACEDTEADNTAGGLDPLCNRYDAEKDPSVGVIHSLNNVISSTGAAGFEKFTLSESILATGAAVSRKLGSTDVAGADALIESASDLGDKVGELVRFYLAAGAQSLRGNIRTNEKAFRVWTEDNALPDAVFARKNYEDTYKTILSWDGLPAIPATSTAAISDLVLATVSNNPKAGADEAARSETAARAKVAFNAALNAKVDLSLTALRQSIAANLTFDDANPFSVRLASDPEMVDFETWAAQALAEEVLYGLSTLASADILKLADERLAAASALATFAGKDNEIIESTAATLKDLITRGRSEHNQNLIDHARTLLKAIGR